MSNGRALEVVDMGLANDGGQILFYDVDVDLAQRLDASFAQGGDPRFAKTLRSSLAALLPSLKMRKSIQHAT